MNLWKQWSRKLDGWVERRRRFQKTGIEKAQQQKAPEAAVATKPKSAADSVKAT